MIKYDCMPKKILYKQLRGALIANEISNAMLARMLNRGSDYISRCLNSRAQFTLAEQYAILKAINRPASEMHLIFPEGGLQIEELAPTDQAVKTSPNQNKRPTQKNDLIGTPIDQILHTTAETLRLQADLLDTLAEVRSQE